MRLLKTLAALLLCAAASAQDVGTTESLPPALLPLNNTDLLLLEQVTPGTPTGYTSRKVYMLNFINYFAQEGAIVAQLNPGAISCNPTISEAFPTSCPTLPIAAIPGIIGDIAVVAGTNSATLATVNSAPGVIGDAAHIPQFTVNGKGLVTATNLVQIVIPVANVTGAAPLASPGLSGIPTAPTASNGTNTTQIATTAFVLANSGGAPSGTASGDLCSTYPAPSVCKINGAAAPVSAAIIGTNGSGQLVPNTSTLANNISGNAATATTAGSATTATTATNATQLAGAAPPTSAAVVGTNSSGQLVANVGTLANNVAGNAATATSATTATNALALAGTTPPTSAQLVGTNSSGQLIAQTGTIGNNTSGNAATATTATTATSATNATQLAGAAPPTSAALVGTNSSGQLVANTGTISNNTTGSAATAATATNATQLSGAAPPSSAAVVGTNGSSQIVAATTTGTGSTVALSVSPALSGEPTVPTATLGTNTFQAASTAFVQAALPTSLPPNGTAGGDLSGSFPNPGVSKLAGAAPPTSAAVVGTNSSGQLVANTGTLANNISGNAATATSATTAGSATTATTATNATQLAGAAPPTSAAVVGTNSSGQLVANTGTLANNTSGNAATATSATSATSATTATNALQLAGATPPASAAVVGTNSSGQLVANTSALANDITGNAATATAATSATTAGTATNATQLAGAAPPTSASLVGTNSSGQLIAQTGTISNNTTGSSTSATNALELAGATPPASATVLGTNSSGQLQAASTSGSGNVAMTSGATFSNIGFSALNVTGAPSQTTSLVYITGNLTSSGSPAFDSNNRAGEIYMNVNDAITWPNTGVGTAGIAAGIYARKTFVSPWDGFESIVHAYSTINAPPQTLTDHTGSQMSTNVVSIHALSNINSSMGGVGGSHLSASGVVDAFNANVFSNPTAPFPFYLGLVQDQEDDLNTRPGEWVADRYAISINLGGGSATTASDEEALYSDAGVKFGTGDNFGSSALGEMLSIGSHAGASPSNYNSIGIKANRRFLGVWQTPNLYLGEDWRETSFANGSSASYTITAVTSLSPSLSQVTLSPNPTGQVVGANITISGITGTNCNGFNSNTANVNGYFVTQLNSSNLVTYANFSAANLSFSSSVGNTTSGILSATWNGATGFYSVTFSDASTRTVSFTNGSKSVSWTGALANTSITTASLSSGNANNGSSCSVAGATATISTPANGGPEAGPGSMITGLGDVYGQSLNAGPQGITSQTGVPTSITVQTARGYFGGAYFGSANDPTIVVDAPPYGGTAATVSIASRVLNAALLVDSNGNSTAGSGVGFAIGDVLTVVGGTTSGGGSAATLLVTGVNSLGGVLSVVTQNKGSYTGSSPAMPSGAMPFPLAFTASVGGLSSGQLIANIAGSTDGAGNFTGTTGSYTAHFSDGEIRIATLTNGSSTVSWTGGALVTSTIYWGSFGGNSNTSGGAGSVQPQISLGFGFPTLSLATAGSGYGCPAPLAYSTKANGYTNQINSVISAVVAMTCTSNPVPILAGVAGTTTVTAAAAGTIGERYSLNCGNLTGVALDGTTPITLTAPAVFKWSTTPPWTLSQNTASFLTNWTCPINFTTTGALPTFSQVQGWYWVIGSTWNPAAGTFQVADTAAHAIAGTNPIGASGSQSGTQTGNLGVTGAFGTLSTNTYTGAGMQLAPGDYECDGLGSFLPSGATGTGYFSSVAGTSTSLGGPGQYQSTRFNSVSLGTTVNYIRAYTQPVWSAGTPSVFQTTQANFTAGNMTESGAVSCRRPR